MFKKLCGSTTFFEAMQIHAICLDAGIDSDKIRLLTYMHFKIKMNDNDIHYFDEAPEIDSHSIELMLGNTTALESHQKTENKSGVVTALLLDHSKTTADAIKKLDVTFRNELGMENRISSELRYRLRLYRNETFRKEMVELYKKTILPRIDLYEQATVQRAFRQARERESLA